MAKKRKQRTDEDNLGRIAYYNAKHPADLSEAEVKEFEELKKKYG